MKAKNLPTAYESYESLKLKRILNFNKTAFKFASKGVFIAFVIIALMIQIIVSYTLS